MAKCSRRRPANARPQGLTVIKIVVRSRRLQGALPWRKHMCDRKIDRRTLGKLLAGAGILPGPALFSGAAHAATVTALAVTCIDYRLVDDAVRFFDSQKLTKDYDQVSLAGAALAAVSDKFPSSNAAFWDHIGIAKQLHHIRKVIVVDHRDCGAYKVAFGKDYKADAVGETAAQT